MKFFFLFLILIKSFIYINNQNYSFVEFKGVYRIDSLFNNYSLTEENNCLQFFDNKNKSGQIFRIIKNENNTFFFEVKKNLKKLGVNINGHVLIVYNSKDRNYKDSIEWNIIQIWENQYLIQNTWNQKFLEIHNNFVQCLNDIPYPIEEHKSEISNSFIFKFVKFIEEVNITQEQEKIINNEPIDVVIKYIDLTDKNLNRKGINQIKKDEDNEELRYSIRSILQYIPWVRKIFILMPNEKVKYFKPYNEINQKIIYVKDKDVLGYESANIYAFTFNLFRLEKFGLSNNFIYMDDDFFIGKELNKSNFFYYEEKENRVVPSLLNMDFYELHRERNLENYNYLFSQKDTLSPHSFKAWVLSLLSTEKFYLDHYPNKTIINPAPSHNAISYNIQDLKEIYNLVINNYEYANETLNSVERHILTLQTQHFVDLYELNIKNRKVHSIKCHVFPMNLLKLDKLNVELFSINTGGDKLYTEEEYRNQNEIMQLRFPNPTPYEIIDKSMVLLNNYNSRDKNFNTEYCIRQIFSLVKENKKLTNKIKIYAFLFFLMALLSLILFYLYYIEKNKNINTYNKIYDSDSRKRLEIID